MRLSLLLAAVSLAAGACREPPPPKASLAETIPMVLVPPGGEVVSRSGSADALQIRFRTPFEMDTVANFYRSVLSRDPWELVSDQRTADGAIALYAEQKGPPLWVTIRKAEGASGTLVDLAGAKTQPH
jgi:hypothetical protein